MTSPKKKTPPKKLASRASPRVVTKGADPDVYVVAPPQRSGVSILLPMPPEMVEAMQEHLDTGMKLRDMFANLAAVDPRELIATLTKAATGLARDKARIARALARRNGTR